MTEQRVAIITGGTRGMGKSMSIALAQRGDIVIAVYRSNEQAALKVRDELQAFSPQSDILQGDVGKKADVDRIVKLSLIHIFCPDIDTMRGLIHKQDLRPVHQPARNDRFLLIPAGQIIDALLQRRCFYSQLIDIFVGYPFYLIFIQNPKLIFEPLQIDHRHVVLHGHLEEQPLYFPALRDQRHTIFDCIFRVFDVHFLAVQFDRALFFLMRAENRLQQLRTSRAYKAGEPKHFSFVQLKGNVFHAAADVYKRQTLTLCGM